MMVLVGALALSAVASASASAVLPEIVNSKGGELVKKKFTSKGTESRDFLTAANHGLFECVGFSGKGEVKGTRGGEETSTYTGCKYASKCQTAGNREGEITFTTSVTPVWLNKAKEEVALLLSLKPGGFQFNCGSPLLQKYTVSGAILVRVGVVNKLNTTYNFATKQTNGIPELREYENEAGEKVTANLKGEASGVENWKNEPMANETAWGTTFEEEAEFKA